MPNPLEAVGAQSGLYALQNYYGAENAKPAWTSPVNNPAAYGSAPGAVTPQITAGMNTGAAISAQNQVYNQLPGYNADIQTAGGNITSELSGQLPQSVMNQIAQAGAERGVATGSPGSPNANASYLQALGLEDINLEQMGQSNLTNLLPQLPGAGIAANPNFYVTPQLQYSAGAENALNAAAPNPYAAAMANLTAEGQGFGAGMGSVGGGGLPRPTSVPTNITTPAIPGAATANPMVAYGPPGMNEYQGNSVTDQQLAAILQEQAGGMYTPGQANNLFSGPDETDPYAATAAATA